MLVIQSVPAPGDIPVTVFEHIFSNPIQAAKWSLK